MKVAETNATVDVDYKALADSYTIPAGNTFGAILVELLRPEILKKRNVTLFWNWKRITILR